MQVRKALGQAAGVPGGQAGRFCCHRSGVRRARCGSSGQWVSSGSRHPTASGPQGSSLCLSIPQRRRHWAAGAAVGPLDRWTDGPAGRRDRRAHPENASRRTGSPHGAHSVQWARPVQAGWPPGPLDTRPRLKGPWPEKGVTNPTMRPRAQAPGQCPRTASTSDPGTPSLPATAQKAASGTSSVSD